MKKSYKKLNSQYLALSFFFVIGIGWQWRGVTFATTEVLPEVAAEPYAALLDKDDLAPVSYGEGSDQLLDEEYIPEEPSFAEATAGEGGSVDDFKQLPDKINLAVPFTSQAPEQNWDQPWQDACEEAAVLMLDAYYKGYGVSPLFAKDELLRMVDWQEALGWGGSISIDKVASLVTEVTGNITPRILQYPTVEQIKESIAAGHPVLAVADGKALPNQYFTGDGPVYHALIIRGYTPTHFITNDPGTQFGENFEYTYDVLMNALGDWNGGDVSNGTPVVLVLQ